jgi:hypothetical protein
MLWKETGMTMKMTIFMVLAMVGMAMGAAVSAPFSYLESFEPSGGQGAWTNIQRLYHTGANPHTGTGGIEIKKGYQYGIENVLAGDEIGAGDYFEGASGTPVEAGIFWDAPSAYKAKTGGVILEIVMGSSVVAAVGSSFQANGSNVGSTNVWFYDGSNWNDTGSDVSGGYNAMHMEIVGNTIKAGTASSTTTYTLGSTVQFDTLRVRTPYAGNSSTSADDVYVNVLPEPTVLALLLLGLGLPFVVYRRRR